ncbi:hypothetical protein TRAPUB_12903 [Trametes pubescens]|uniref:Uncharacterized protein n=1 Tax=Trametes pubescens TaxID=154538 RepID=A0A1M2VSM2_TRAPU|nr:hypothetical protein TRAPUB_12903 [Trametes pubescens]
MHLFRSVFIFGVAALAFVAMEAPQASAFILPMTRYMLDAIPDGAEASDGDVAPAPDGSASVADNIANPDVPVAVDTPAVVPADNQGQAEEPSAGSSEVPAPPSDTSAEPADAATATSSISTPEPSPSPDLASSVSPAIPSALVSDNILAQANAANHVVGLGGSGVLVGSVLATILFAL